MRLNRILSAAFLGALLFTTSCSDNNFEQVTGDVNYVGGIFITNEGKFTGNNASVDFITSDIMYGARDIYKNANNTPTTGDVLQSMGFNGSNAYLVLNNNNKVVIVNRATFKKTGEITQGLDQPRYVAFSNGYTYVTNNNASAVKKLNVYNADATLKTSIPFPNYADKVVEAGGKIVVQSDGTGYDASWNEIPTGHTITIVNPTDNTAQTPINLPASGGIIKDLISYGGFAYVVSSTATDSYIYKINPADGTFTTTTLTGIPATANLRIDSNKFYFLTQAGKIYSTSLTTPSVPTIPLITFNGYAYGFNVINGKIFISDASFTGNSTTYIFNGTSGAQLTTLTTGVGTNGFYLNQ